MLTVRLDKRSLVVHQRWSFGKRVLTFIKLKRSPIEPASWRNLIPPTILLTLMHLEEA